MPNDPASRRAALRRLHERGCFVLPNPWDAGSARFLQSLGFPGLATTSAGHAFSLGLPDGAVLRETTLAHLRAMVEATDVPLNADFESGFANDPAGAAESVRLCIATGVAGLSIEDSTRDGATRGGGGGDRQIRDPPEPIHAQCAAPRAALTARIGSHIVVGRGRASDSPSMATNGVNPYFA